MKQTLTVLFLWLVSLCQAQTNMQVKMKDGSCLTIPADQIKDIRFEKIESASKEGQPSSRQLSHADCLQRRTPMNYTAYWLLAAEQQSKQRRKSWVLDSRQPLWTGNDSYLYSYFEKSDATALIDMTSITDIK